MPEVRGIGARNYIFTYWHRRMGSARTFVADGNDHGSTFEVEAVQFWRQLGRCILEPLSGRDSLTFRGTTLVLVVGCPYAHQHIIDVLAGSDLGSEFLPARAALRLDPCMPSVQNQGSVTKGGLP